MKLNIKLTKRFSAIIFGLFFLGQAELTLAENSFAPSKEIAEKRLELGYDLFGLNQHPAVTQLSKKALQLRIGNSEKEVYKLLGQPTWASKEEGVGLVWRWANHSCDSVYVVFSEKGRVKSYSQGRSNCNSSREDTDEEAFSSYLCKDNSNLCFPSN